MARRRSNDPFDLIRIMQTVLKDTKNAACLAAKTGGEYREGEICGNSAGGRRHTISNAAYLEPMAESKHVLSVLPIDAPHIAHHARSSGRIAGKRRLKMASLPPKCISIDDASTGYFACDEHDGKFQPIDTGIPFPTSHEYMRITTEGTTEADRALEETLFLMAYRSVLSALCILRGLDKVLRQLRVENRMEKGKLSRHANENYRSYDRLLKYKRPYDARFAGVQGYNMTHHLIAGQPHTRLAMSGIGTDATTNILPCDGVSRIVVSHATDEPRERQQEAENSLTNALKELSDRDDKKPFVELASSAFDAYISPADYREWSEEDKGALRRASAETMNQWLAWN